MLDPTVSECKDCASHSRAWGVDAVDDVVEKDKLVALETKEAGGFKDWGVTEPDEEVDLKEERRFWAEDLRRIVGRCGCWSENILSAFRIKLARKLYVPKQLVPVGLGVKVGRVPVYK
jgi:hypothetical protein